MRQKKKTVGIIGGMGPEATAYFYWLIIKNTKAIKDQDHIHVLIDSYPQIPPRTDAILGIGPSPLPHLVKAAKRLEMAGANFLVMPCITAHYYYDRLLKKIKIPLISLIEETRREADRLTPGPAKIGLIASRGTVASGLFHQVLQKTGKQVITPTEAEQDKVMEAIFGPEGIKAGVTRGKPREVIVATAQKLIRRGAAAIIAGCTEIPLVLKPEDIRVPLFEPMTLAARACIKLAGYELREDLPPAID